MKKVVPIEISARHVHLSKEHLAVLFGVGYELKVAKGLSQPGQFKAEEKVSIKSEKGEILNVAIIGPCREETQVEISATDARKLGINPPVRLSGDLEGSASITLTSPAGELLITAGVIIAARHLHCDSTTASDWKLNDGQKICIEVDGERSVIFKNVVVRVDPNFKLAFHIDADEGNAVFGLDKVGEVVIIF